MVYRLRRIEDGPRTRLKPSSGKFRGPARRPRPGAQGGLLEPVTDSSLQHDGIETECVVSYRVVVEIQVNLGLKVG